jgi:hypothetical protein
MRKPQQRAFYRVLIKKSPYHSDRVAESYCNQSTVFRRNVAAANGELAIGMVKNRHYSAPG